MKILTFDIEEWFHILDNPRTQSEEKWKAFPSRIHKGMESIHHIMNQSNNQEATFFVLGWIAEKYPELIRELADKGYEIGSHTHLHQLAYNQDRQTFKNDVERSIKTLEDCIGKKVISFRAPGFSITEQNKWAFQVLFELGIKIDCSVFPAGRAHGGFPAYDVAVPSLLSYNGVTIKEFPINTLDAFGKPIIFSGGGYFRLAPYLLLKKWMQKSEYVMTYFHPRDFDFEQPLVPGLSLSRRFKSYVGLRGAKNKLLKITNDFDFISLKTADSLVDWDSSPVVEIF